MLPRIIGFTFFLIGSIAVNCWAADLSLEERIRRLEQQNAALQQELAALKGEILSSSSQAPAAITHQQDGPAVSFNGQYRINSYTVDNDAGGDNQTASRVRIRQGLDVEFDEQLKTHVQLELGHTTSNVTTTSKDLKVRHAVLDYTFNNDVNALAGIVPLGDHFGDVLFSSDWDYNPVALSVTLPAAGGRLRAFAANLAEGDEAVADDDFVHYQLDYALPFGHDHEINFGLTYADVSDFADPVSSHTHINLGTGLQYRFNDQLTFNSFLMGSWTDKGLLGTAGDGDGVAVKLELTGSLGPGDFGLMLTHASGEKDASGFLPIMGLARTNGYWGYTGILTVQGATDTGFDGDSINLSNNGYGLTSVQAKYVLPVTERLGLQLAAGWFGGADTPSGRGDNVGTDLLLMGTYRLHRFLSLDFGAAYARLKDALSGYSNGVIDGASFNQGPGVTRNKTALFARLQTEY